MEKSYKTLKMSLVLRHWCYSLSISVKHGQKYNVDPLKQLFYFQKDLEKLKIVIGIVSTYCLWYLMNYVTPVTILSNTSDDFSISKVWQKNMIWTY